MRTNPALHVPAALMVALLTGCADSPTQVKSTAPDNTPITSIPVPALDVTLDKMAAESQALGDASGAAAFGDAAIAIRLGVRPTEIAVVVAGETVRYRAMVAGFSETSAAGLTVVRRSLVAWTGAERPKAILQVNSKSDNATFGSTTDAPRASGSWADLVLKTRFMATAGNAHIILHPTDGTCGSTATNALGVVCTLARYSVAVEGLFRQPTKGDAPTAEGTRIKIPESVVVGVVLTRPRPATQPPVTRR